ncbi:MAG: MFS transporter, partial [Candidatus Zophobacter franzmannii]|nr:MFS transporter [Candidatus Zophobacter franzmannii]
MRIAITPAALITRGHNLSARYTALHHRNFRLFWFGQMISLVGTWMQNVAQGWLVYQLTGSAFALGLVGMAASLPVLILSLFGGVIADRFDRRNTLLVTQTAAMIQALFMAWLIWAGHIQVWHVYLLSFTLGMINAMDTPTRQAFVVDLVAKQDVPNAVALNSTVFNLARVVGPAVAAILIASVGIAAAYLINGVTFIAVLIGLAMIRMPQGIVRSTTRS